MANALARFPRKPSQNLACPLAREPPPGACPKRQRRLSRQHSATDLLYPVHPLHPGSMAFPMTLTSTRECSYKVDAKKKDQGAQVHPVMEPTISAWRSWWFYLFERETV